MGYGHMAGSGYVVHLFRAKPKGISSRLSATLKILKPGNDQHSGGTRESASACSGPRNRKRPPETELSRRGRSVGSSYPHVIGQIFLLHVYSKSIDLAGSPREPSAPPSKPCRLSRAWHPLQILDLRMAGRLPNGCSKEQCLKSSPIKREDKEGRTS